MVDSTILQLKKGADACPEGDKITLYRGGNTFLLKSTPESKVPRFVGRVGGWFFLSNATLNRTPFDSVRASKTSGSWTYLTMPFEDQFLTSERVRAARYRPLAGWLDFANLKDGDTPILKDPFDYDGISGKHTGSSTGSPLISMSSSFSVAVSYGLPVISARFCPGRVFPTHSQQWSNELEWLTFEAIFPEEI
jgi:hypothetical protein